jgi:hypothetical protein
MSATPAAKPTKTPTKRAPAKAATAEPKPDLKLIKPTQKVINGILYEPVYLHRFLFDNGDVVDVQAIRDDSNLRGLLLDQRKKDGIKDDRIAGSARVEFLGYPDMESLTQL